MKRFSALAVKEIRQHGLPFSLLLFFETLLFGLILLGTYTGESVTVLEAHQGFMIFFVPLAAIVLGRRLVVGEYYARTQLYLEGLPLSRAEMLLVKLILGLVALEGIAFASLGTSLVAAFFRETLDAWFVTILVAKTAFFTAGVWAFFFTMGLIGRLRVTLYFFFFIALYLVDEQTAFDLEEFGLFALVHPATMPFERETMPVGHLAQTAVWTGFWVALAFGLGLIREGSLTESLGRRMTQKEKALTAVLVIAMLMGLAFFEERQQREPYRFPEEAVFRSDEQPIEILYLLPSLRPAAADLGQHLDKILGDFANYLGWNELPPVRLAHRAGLDGDRFEEAELTEDEGILIRLNFTSDALDLPALTAYLSGEVLDAQTDERAQFEPYAWFRDGLATWWGAPATSSPDVLTGSCSERRLLGLWASADLNAESIQRWHLFRERHGKEAANAVALSGIEILAARHGGDAVQRLAQTFFPEDVPEDFGTTLRERLKPMPRRFEEAIGEPWQDFLRAWLDELKAQRDSGPCNPRLAELPEATAGVDVEIGDGSIRDVVFTLSFSEPPPPDLAVTLLHSRLDPFDAELDEEDLRRRESLWDDGSTQGRWRLPGLYGRGSRAFLALDVDWPGLGEVRLVAERRNFR